MSDRSISILFLLFACLLLAIGRLLIRRARRSTSARLPKRTLAWTLLLFGLLFMIFGVLLW